MKNFATRPDSSVIQFKMRVPRSVLEHVRGMEIVLELPAVGAEQASVFRTTLGEFAKGSLHTRNAETADARRLIVLAHLAKVYGAAKAEPIRLTQRQIQGLAGQVYRLLDEEHGDDPGTEAEWTAFKAITRAAVEGRIPGAQAIPLRGRSDDAIMATLLFGEDPETLTASIDSRAASWGTSALEQRVGRLAVWVLQRNGIEVDPATRLILLREIAKAALQFGHHAKRLARGDFRPDPDADRFPEFEKTKAKGVTLWAVFERWKAEVKPTPSTISTWRGVIRSLESHLKEDIEVGRLTQADVLGWKDSLVERGVRPKTVNDQHLAGLKAMLNFAVRNGLTPANVAQGVRLQVKAKAGERMLPYSDEDVAALLAHAARETSPAKRWLPLLAVLTGARIGELAQMWGSQVREVDGVPVIEIRPAPDGATLKNAASERTVPLHPALVEEGFVTFARGRGDAPLFYRKPARRGAEAKHPSKGVSNHLASWIRSLPGFDDPRKAPAHAARHWFKTTGARLEIMDSLVNAIQGHVDGSTAGVYRHFTVPQMARAVARYPVPIIAESKQAVPCFMLEPAELTNEQHR